MHSRLNLAGLAVAALLAGCNDKTTFDDIAPKAEQRLPDKIVQVMKSKGMSESSPIMVRIFKEEGQFEVWKQKGNGRYDLVTSYPICKISGELGPKYIEGDRQAPEGFYMIHPAQMNPKSSYYLSFNIGFPNAYDRAHGRTGNNIMVHGACSSSGCYSMSDAQVGQIYAFARDAFRGGQQAFQIQAFPFRMTAANMARYRRDPNVEFWKMLKEGYDHFEVTKVPPKVDVCNGKYVFDETPAAGHSFTPGGACPPMSQPPALVAAMQGYQKSYDLAYAAAAKADKGGPTRPTIEGIKEANLVADWSKRRARGERVTLDPPTLTADGKVAQTTTRMARIDSPLGRKMAALDAEKEAKEEAAKQAAQQKAAAIAAAKVDKDAREAQAGSAKKATATADAGAAVSGKASGKQVASAKDAKTPNAGKKAGDSKAGEGDAATAQAADTSAVPAENALAPTDTSDSIGKRIWKKMFGS